MDRRPSTPGLRPGWTSLLTRPCAQLPGSTDDAASFEVIDEGHTLGNALRYIVMKKCASPLSPFSPPARAACDSTLTLASPDVEFCAYAIPHPSEPKMNIRIQTYGQQALAGDPAPANGERMLTRGTEGTAVDALRKGLVELQEVCDVVAEEFWAKREAFNADKSLTR